MRIRIQKRAEVTGGLPACEAGSYTSGTAQAAGFSIPIEYSAEGELARPLQVGEGLIMLRDTRNGVKCPGVFQTSPIIEITRDSFMTKNSVYDYEYLTSEPESV